MKTNHLQKMLAVVVVAGLSLSSATLPAQTSPVSPVPQAAVVASVPPLSGNESQILRLVQAKVGDDTIVAYIKNSGNGYSLTADQIIYLKQQGLSDAVISAMLNRQPGPAVTVASAPPVPQQSVSTVTTQSGSTATVAPAVTYVQTVPSTAYYYQPYYYPDYAWYPPVAFSFGWGGGWRGGGFHGGGWRR